MTFTNKIALVMQYRPSFIMDSQFYGVYQAMETLPGPGSSIQKINSLLSMVYSNIIPIARKMGLPLIDLSNSFDIMNPELYECQIESSSKGGELIAKLIGHVLRTYDFNDENRQSCFYSLQPSRHAAAFVATDKEFSTFVDCEPNIVGSEKSWRIGI